MLWAVQNEWPSVAQCTFNCYLQWDTLVIRDGGGTRDLIYRKEGVTQGYPLAIILYGIGVLTLVR